MTDISEQEGDITWKDFDANTPNKEADELYKALSQQKKQSDIHQINPTPDNDQSYQS